MKKFKNQKLSRKTYTLPSSANEAPVREPRIRILFKNLEKSEFALSIARERIGEVVEKFPDLENHRIRLVLSMENSSQQPGPDLFTVKITIHGSRYRNVIMGKSAHNFYGALAELKEHLLERLNRSGDRKRVVSRNKRRQHKLSLRRYEMVSERENYSDSPPLGSGFDEDSAQMLFMVSLLEVAWADDEISPEEREKIFRIMAERGIEKSSREFKLVSSWLTDKPTDEIFVKAKSLCGPAIDELGKLGYGDAGCISESARQVAMASGDALSSIGIGGKISIKEEDVLEQIDNRIGLKKRLKGD